MGEITATLKKASHNKAEAVDRLYSLLYKELRAVARRQLRRGDLRRNVDTTQILHESYLKLRDSWSFKPQSRTQFFAYAAHVMRSVIVDLARGQLAQKRGAGRHLALRIDLIDSVPAGDDQLMRINEALNDLATTDPKLGQIAEMRYFGGLSEVEVAKALGISRRTVQREWEKARLFLFAHLSAR